jgi:hypothetical protein
MLRSCFCISPALSGHGALKRVQGTQGSLEGDFLTVFAEELGSNPVSGQEVVIEPEDCEHLFCISSPFFIRLVRQ